MIIDASVALKWIVVEDDTDLAEKLLGRIDLMAPSFVHIEVANAIWKKRRRGELGDVSDLLKLPLMLAEILQTIDEASVLGRALEIALLLDHAIYDCIYLAMAEQLDTELITADLKFIRKIQQTDLSHILRQL